MIIGGHELGIHERYDGVDYFRSALRSQRYQTGCLPDRRGYGGGLLSGLRLMHKAKIMP